MKPDDNLSFPLESHLVSACISDSVALRPVVCLACLCLFYFIMRRFLDDESCVINIVIKLKYKNIPVEGNSTNGHLFSQAFFGHLKKSLL